MRGRKGGEVSNPLKPSPALLCKLGSIAVHADELISPNCHEFDRIALQNLFDSEVKEWIEAMTEMAMVPLKRNRKATP